MDHAEIIYEQNASKIVKLTEGKLLSKIKVASFYGTLTALY